jgi:hypothetical protein
MKKLIALLFGVLAAIGAVVTILFFWRKKQGSWGSTWDSARDTATSWGNTAADQADKAASKASAAADDARKQASSAVEEARSQLGGEA